MRECEPHGFKVKVSDALTAAENAIWYAEQKKEKALDLATQKSMKRFFFKDRTYEEAREKLLKEESILDDWSFVGAWTLDWGKTMKSSLSVVQGEFIWLTQSEADDVARYLRIQRQD